MASKVSKGTNALSKNYDKVNQSQQDPILGYKESQMLQASQDKMTLKNSSDISLPVSPLKKQDSGTSKVIYTSRLADTPGL